ncbi:hypothetical protein HPB49_000557 [Dermacentor silvarum]|uniref:Uncharacterized protein n=2 Tax=Dermacentor silvarum TaxID=543639 RepID=A0ACB8DHP2_DERSI|nr:hypothetical protein HPB49_000557 [Dermacentor silvarum]
MEKKKNFSEEERAVLLELLSRHRSVVENKRTDAASVSRKRQAWEKIEDEFNCRHNVTPRKWIQLKKCWENLKDKWRRTNAEDMRERFATGGGTPPPSQMTDELQRVGDIASHMAVRLPNPCDSDRSRHNAVPGGSQPSKSQCTPAVAALLSETQDRPLEQFAGCQDMYDESTDLWSWDDNSSPMEDASTNTARPHGQVQDTSDSQPRNGGGAKPSEAAAVPSAASSSAAAAASSSAAVPAGTKRASTCSSQRQTAVSIELGARLDAIKEDRDQKKNEHLLRLKFMRIEHKQKKAQHSEKLELFRLKIANQKAKAEMVKLQLDIMKKQYE